MKTLKQFLQRLAHFFGLGTNDPLTSLAQKIETRATLETIPLAESQKQILCDISTNARDSRSQPGGKAIVLFAGVNRTGKTSAAEVIAGDLKRDLYRVDLNKIVSKYIGETEKNLNRLFNAAESAGAVLFFDEAEALFGKRSEVKDGHDRYANLEISYLLQLLESFSGLVVLATNNEEDTPEKFRRRIRFIMDFPPSD
ncbi:MAG TPA: ATP-binding protein [Pyrinomonadaceae bacterium]|nr:ATP-binding protein [Pyrinomonadaceae bacterium]